MANTTKIVLMYVPVIHQGYLNFLDKYDGLPVWLMGESFSELSRPLQKDLRRMSASAVKKSLAALEKVSVEVVEISSLGERLLKNGVSKVVMPAEDISRLVAQKYLGEVEVEYDETFLRWDRDKSLAEVALDGAPAMTAEAFQKGVLALAQAEADLSSDWWRRVGAVLVRDGQALLSAHNQHLPHEYEPYMSGDARANFHKGEEMDKTTAIHAEASVVAAAARQGLATDGAELYVTTFPCPSCAKMVAQSGIKKLYFSEGYAVLDGETVMKAAGVEICKISL